MKICENCGTVSNFTEGYCKSCNSTKIIDLQTSTEEWFKLNKSQKENKIKECLSVTNEQYELLQEAWVNNKTNITPIKQSPNTQTHKQNVPKCPTCGSTNVQKLSTTSKVVSLGLLGLASKTVGKTYKCKNCGYHW